mmetsp:Transcript_143/g.341  ORF Transcript_143/g.341 Transcript_143/m.341 type:complete len:250 (-) Transcript_143:54-803(-)
MLVLNMRLNGNDAPKASPLGALHPYFFSCSSSSVGEKASACICMRRCPSLSSVGMSGLPSMSSSIASSSSLSARKHSPLTGSLTMRSVKRSTWPDVLRTTSGVRHVHSISSMDSARTKCFRQTSTMAALSPHAGGPRSNSPFTPPCISKLGTMNIFRRMSSSKDLRLNCTVGSSSSFFRRSTSASSLSALRASTAEPISSAFDDEAFFRDRTCAPCLVIFALRASMSSCRAEDSADMVPVVLVLVPTSI